MITDNDIVITSATECREWLLHFSVPVLDGVLPPVVYVHYMLLVSAINLLNKEKVLMDEISYAEILLLDFCRLFPEVYGKYDYKSAICCKLVVKSRQEKEQKKNQCVVHKFLFFNIFFHQFVSALCVFSCYHNF